MAYSISDPQSVFCLVCFWHEICKIFHTSQFPNVLILPEKTWKSRHFLPKIDIGRCFTQLFWTIVSLFSNIYSTTNSLKLSYEKQAWIRQISQIGEFFVLNLENFTRAQTSFYTCATFDKFHVWFEMLFLWYSNLLMPTLLWLKGF